MTLLLHKEIERLKKELLALGAIVEELLRKAVRALQARDAKLAREVMEADERVDNREVELEEDGLKIIALHQPVAIDLRFIVSVLRINSDLERIGDLAVNIAERARYLAGAEPLAVPIDFRPMAETAQEMLTKSLDAFVNMDTTLAQQILHDRAEREEFLLEAFDLLVQQEGHRRLSFAGISRSARSRSPSSRAGAA